MKVQSALLKGKTKKQDGAENERPALTIVKPENGEAGDKADDKAAS